MSTMFMDPQTYVTIAFKRKIYYLDKTPLQTRDAFMRWTKDGTRPLLGIQEVFLLTPEKYKEFSASTESTAYTRCWVRQFASYSITCKYGFKKL